MDNNKDKQSVKWQSQKSALTRDRVVIATLECIVIYGYENTTMAKIVKVAKLSQGAFQYHFSSKIEAIKAAINYLHSQRLADHQRALEEAPPGVDPQAHIVDFYWRQLNEDHFCAYQDLVIAARTHPELASVLQPAYQSFEKTWRRNAVSSIGQLVDVEQFNLIADLGQYVMEGLAYGRLNLQIDDKRTERLLQFTKQLFVDLMANNLQVKSLPKKPKKKPKK